MLFDQLSQRLSAHQRSLSACTHIGRKAFCSADNTFFPKRMPLSYMRQRLFVFWRRTQADQGSGLEIRQTVQAVREFESHRRRHIAPLYHGTLKVPIPAFIQIHMLR